MQLVLLLVPPTWGVVPPGQEKVLYYLPFGRILSYAKGLSLLPGSRNPHRSLSSFVIIVRYLSPSEAGRGRS